ncbi:hypothetical protein ICM05_05300 [Leucobacter sp. cx-42]|uniref:hypothetical protein n=1 Tax=unclassified Leucobacter TaxID=2621730 RepID=UPI00165D7A83|nr:MULTISPECIES: hypothetical protein [unclassified Leucobacter]MBC9954062.1 hypothetical protein [Leucobacter sp. cx-42]
MNLPTPKTISVATLTVFTALVLAGCSTVSSPAEKTSDDPASSSSVAPTETPTEDVIQERYELPEGVSTLTIGGVEHTCAEDPEVGQATSINTAIVPANSTDAVKLDTGEWVLLTCGYPASDDLLRMLEEEGIDIN